MLFLVYLSIEESTSGVSEYNRGRKRSEVPAKQKSSPGAFCFIYTASFTACSSCSNAWVRVAFEGRSPLEENLHFIPAMACFLPYT